MKECSSFEEPETEDTGLAMKKTKDIFKTSGLSMSCDSDFAFSLKTINSPLHRIGCRDNQTHPLCFLPELALSFLRMFNENSRINFTDMRHQIS